MRTLPVLAGRSRELETCVFCPKLCRGTCPVSNAEPRETLTPWGKMTTAWMVAHGDVPADAQTAAPAWACTGCLACSAMCEHSNPVGDTLLDARDATGALGLAPPGAARALGRFARHAAKTRDAARRLAARAGLPARAPDAVLVGCAYLRAAPDEARAAVDVASQLAGGPVAVVDACCGLPLRLAGDRRAFERHAAGVARSLAPFERVFAVDAGCALTLKTRYRETTGVDIGARTVVLVEAAARELARRGPRSSAPLVPSGEAVRWHDPCALGRGLGIYDAPRAVLARALGRAPDEFEDAREDAACSGGGGLLPATMPDVARAIAESRIESHERAGGGRVVTGCASSLVALRARGRAAGVHVDDIVTWAARALRA
jgi:Fe-S oxidoreductase